jgi:PKD repeat protein
MDKRLWLVAVFLVLFLVSSVGAFSGSGAGTSGDPYQITTYSQLDEMRNSLSAYYILNNDIDCAGNTWVPLINFKGQLNGNYYVIKNLYIYETYERASGYDVTAAFIGIADGTIYPILTKLVFYNASVTSYNTTEGENSAVGIGYWAQGGAPVRRMLDTVFFDRCHVYRTAGNPGNADTLGIAIGQVTGTCTNVGIFNSTISITGDTSTASGETDVAPFAYSAENITYSYADVGFTFGTSGYYPPTGVAFFGGLTSYTSTPWYSSYYCYDCPGALHVPTGTQDKTTAQLQTQSTFTGWDFTNVWVMGNSTWNGMPIFKHTPWFGTPDAIAPVAAFSANSTSGASPLNVGFTDASTNTPTNWDWYWGADETKSSDDQNPTNSFTTGTYNIRLWASNSAGGDWENKTTYITSGVIPVTAFSANVTSGASPLNVGFTDASTNSPDNWDWYWGADETKSSDLQNPSTSLTTGTYNVRLWSSNSLGGDWENKTAYITVGDSPTASFTKDKTSGAAPLTVTFDGTYTGTAPLTYLWVFGDGDTTNNSVADPIHTFAGVGTYDVNVTVSNAYGSQTTATQGISVGVAPVANFTRVPTTAQPDGTTYTFTDTSSGATSWLWEWNDGTANSTLQNPTHQYTISSGNTQTWTVNLTATNAYGSDKKVYTTCVGEYKIITANFTTANNVGAIPLTVTFTDTSVNNTNRQYDWENNGTWSANQASPATYTYTVAGIYSPRIKAFNTWNTAYLTKTNEVNAGTTILADFTASNVTPIEEQTITFTDASLGTPTTWNWSFGDGQYSSLQNPTHAYSGWSITYFKLFNVTLNITKSGVPNATLTKTNYINVSQIKPTILPYTVNKTSGTGYAPPGLPVQFGNQYSYGYADAFDWYFEGVHNTSLNPIVTFNVPGVFHVNYSATNEMGRSAWYNSTYSVLGHAPTVSGITVSPPVGTHYAPTATTMNVIETTQYAIQPVTYVWHYDDGTPDVTVVSSNTFWTPDQFVWGNHTFTTAGSFNVTVNASNAWGHDDSQFIVYNVSPPALFGAPLKWVNNAGATITTARKGDALTFVFDTNGTGLGGAYNYDRFYINVFRQDMTGAWVEALEVTNYNVQEYGIATMFSSGIHNWMPTGKRWNGYTTFTAANGNATYRGQVTAVNATSSITYPSSVLYADISVTDNPLLMSNVGQAANDTGGFALKLIIGVIIVLGLMAIPFLITREFNTYIEVFMIVLGLGLNYYLGLIDLWIIAGLGILAAVIVFFMSTGGRGGGDTTEGGGGDVG